MFLQGCQNCILHVHKYEKSFLNFFLNISGILSQLLLKNYSVSLAELHSTCPEEQFKKSFSGKNFEKFFGMLAISFRSYCRISLAEFCKLYSAVYLSRVKLWRIFSQKTLFIFFWNSSEPSCCLKEKSSKIVYIAIQLSRGTSWRYFQKRLIGKNFPLWTKLSQTFDWKRSWRLPRLHSTYIVIFLWNSFSEASWKKDGKTLKFCRKFQQVSEDCSLHIQRNRIRNFFDKVLGNFENFLPTSDKKFSVGL